MVILIVLGFLGFRVVYNPELAINWEATATVVSIIVTILTFIAIQVAFTSNRIAEKAIDKADDANEIAKNAVVTAISANKIAENALTELVRQGEQSIESNKIAKDTLVEMIQQRNEANRPYIVINIEFDLNNIWFIILNEGTLTAQDVKLNFEDDFIKLFEEQRGNTLKYFNTLRDSAIDIAPNQKYRFFFSNVHDGGNVRLPLKDGMPQRSVVTDLVFQKYIKGEVNAITIFYEYRNQDTKYEDKTTFNFEHYSQFSTSKSPLYNIDKAFEGFNFQVFDYFYKKHNSEIKSILREMIDKGSKEDG